MLEIMSGKTLGEATSPMSNTLDAFHRGRFHVFQSNDGAHRSGMDALILASIVPQNMKGKIADFGAGCGVVAMACAQRVKGISVDLVECDKQTLELAEKSISLPENYHLLGRLKILEADLCQSAIIRRNAGLEAQTYQYVLANPPYNDASHRKSPNQQRVDAHNMAPDTLELWVRAAADALTGNGYLAFILRPENIDTMLIALKRAFGSVVILPLHSKAEKPASRIIVSARKGGRGPLKILPGFILHNGDGTFTNGDGTFTAQANAIFDGEAGISLD